MLIDGILEALHKVVPPGAHPLHAPEFAGREWEYVKDCLDTGWVSSVGNYVDRFESMLADFTGAKRVIATVNGTAALHVCLLLAGVEEGDEVVIPDLTFVATANAVAYCRATPVLADVEERTLGLAPAPLAAWLADNTHSENGNCIDRHTGRRIRAVVPMHTFGHPVDLDPLVELCDQYHLILIEDAAESLGSLYRGRHTGRFGRLAALSFNGNKTVTTGGGGAIMTDDEELGRLAKHLTTTARQPHRWEFFHDMTGYNYRLPNLNAALGCAQLERLPEFLRRKRALAQAYHRAFEGIPGAAIFREPEFARSNYWLNVLLLDEAQALHRNALLEVTNACGICTRPAWTLMHHLPMYAACPRLPTPVAESLACRLINLPSSPRLAPA